MRKPYETGAKPNEMPNEPRMAPNLGKVKGPQADSSPSLDNMAGDAQIKPPAQMETIAHKIEAEHVFGTKSNDVSPIHQSPSNFSPRKVKDFGNTEKVKEVKVSQVKPRLPKGGV